MTYVDERFLGEGLGSAAKLEGYHPLPYVGNHVAGARFAAVLF